MRNCRDSGCIQNSRASIIDVSRSNDGGSFRNCANDFFCRYRNQCHAMLISNALGDVDVCWEIVDVNHDFCAATTKCNCRHQCFVQIDRCVVTTDHRILSCTNERCDHVAYSQRHRKPIFIPRTNQTFTPFNFNCVMQYFT